MSMWGLEVPSLIYKQKILECLYFQGFFCSYLRGIFLCFFVVLNSKNGRKNSAIIPSEIKLIIQWFIVVKFES